MDEDNKKIEVVEGNVEDLDISPVYEHLDIGKPNTEKKKEIVIPKEKKDISKESENDEDEEEEDKNNE